MRTSKYSVDCILEQIFEVQKNTLSNSRLSGDYPWQHLKERRLETTRQRGRVELAGGNQFRCWNCQQWDVVSLAMLATASHGKPHPPY